MIWNNSLRLFYRATNKNSKRRLQTVGHSRTCPSDLEHHGGRLRGTVLDKMETSKPRRLMLGLPLDLENVGCCIPRGSNVVPSRVVRIIPEEKTSHNQTGSTLEPLGGNGVGPVLLRTAPRRSLKGPVKGQPWFRTGRRPRFAKGAHS